MNHITLLGSEAVERAGSAMRQAADEMQRAASTFEAAAERLTRAMEDHACRIEATGLRAALVMKSLCRRSYCNDR